MGWLVGLLVLVMAGCAPAAHPHRSAWQFEAIEPLVRAEVLPKYDFGSSRTVTVLRLAGTEYATSLSAIAERQALQAAVYVLEGMGYSYVETLEDADLVVAISYADNPYRTSYVPPATVAVPRYVPGQTFTTQSRTSTNAWAQGSWGWGTGYGTSNSTSVTTTPGYWTTDTVTRSGYTTGAYYPTIGLTLLDAASGETVFSGSYVGVTQIPDLRVTLPWGITHILANLPIGAEPSGCGQRVQFQVGLATILGTLDGNGYYPVVTGLDPAMVVKSGDILIEDLVIAVNGRSVEAAGFCEFWQAFRLDQPGDVNLRLWRGDRAVEVVVGKRPL